MSRHISKVDIRLFVRHAAAVIAAAVLFIALPVIAGMFCNVAAEACKENDPAYAGGTLMTGVEHVYAADSDGLPDYITDEGFPDSYLSMLAELHEQHPKWKFTPVATGLKWSDAVKKMTANPGVNTIWYSYTPSYKSVVEGRYNYLKDTYTGGKFPAASEQAVKYFMDPRNFLTERNVFLFEDRKFHSYQKKAIVKKVLRRNEALAAEAGTFYKAGKKYDISPLYLASKSFAELGTSTFMMDGHKFKYGGIKYKDCYNAYNIGASDSLGAVGGLIYANGGKASKNYAAGPNKTYGRKWDTPAKAVRGGARYLNSSYIKNNQATAYTEHFNVLNGLDSVGTHVYMTALNGGISIAGQISSKYDEYGIFDKELEFYIPVYKKMPSKPCSRPSSSEKKDNNYYLKKLSVKYTVPADGMSLQDKSETADNGKAADRSEPSEGGKTSDGSETSEGGKTSDGSETSDNGKAAGGITADNGKAVSGITLTSDGDQGKTKTKKFITASKLNYKTAFKLKVPAGVDQVKITAAAACQPSSKKKGATVNGDGTYELAEGTNEFIVVCKASSGVKRNYKITVIRN